MEKQQNHGLARAKKDAKRLLDIASKNGGILEIRKLSDAQKVVASI